MLELNKKQSELFNFIVNNNKGQILLNAAGGTGKTHFIKYLVSVKRNWNIKVLAPTHKAKSLFEMKGIRCDTIHRFLKAKKDIDENTGEIFFKFQDTYEDYDLIIVDECSMIDSKMFDMLRKFEYVLYTGDDHQIPPVNETLSKVFKKCDRSFTFEKNERMDENPDSMSAIYLEKFRKSVDKFKKIQIEFRRNIDDVVKCFKNGDDVVLLAWTNKQVWYRNGEIRSKLFKKPGEDLKKYYEGEKLIFSGWRRATVKVPVEKVSEPVKNSEDEDEDVSKFLTSTISLTYHSSQSIHITELTECKKIIPFNRCKHQLSPDKLKTCKECDVKGHRYTEHEIRFYVITDQNGVLWWKPYDAKEKKKINEILSDLKRSCMQLKDKNLWKEYYKLKNTYNPDLLYEYCMTVHKSQGSQWSKVFVDINNIRHCRDVKLLARLSYTAVSRFKKYVFFI